MAYLLFLDESGRDRQESPYEVLAGLAIRDSQLWDLIKAIQATEIKYFGARYSGGERELKAKKLLKRRVFVQAGQMPPMQEQERQALTRDCLKAGSKATRTQLTALAQSKIAYANDFLNLCKQFNCKAFASIVAQSASRQNGSSYLRKDYAFLFERFYYFLEDTEPESSGLIVFDELEKVQSHILIEQIDRYFSRTWKGQQRAGRIIPEPFFVHSNLTTGIQLADLIAYTLSWGFLAPDRTNPARIELKELSDKVKSMRHKTVRQINNNPAFKIWSFTFLTDLRTRNDRDIF